MTVVYVLAHFDDEYCALPLIEEAHDAGLAQLFVYVVDYPSAAIRAQRHAESCRFLTWLGLDGAAAVHLGPASGAVDGGLHRALPTAYSALAAALNGVAIERLVCPAWEGGHMDHDMCALLTGQLAAERGGPPIETISLYNAQGLPAPWFHGGRPLVENGPVRKFSLAAGGLLRWMLAVRFFIRQRAWLGLWPTMFWTYWTRGFGVQRLDPRRIHERPHAGPLLYERMFNVPYDEVRAAADAFLNRPPAGPA